MSRQVAGWFAAALRAARTNVTGVTDVLGVMGAIGLVAALGVAPGAGAEEELRDPTAPPAVPSGELPPAPAEPGAAASGEAPLTLTSIVIGPGRRIATIDGRVLRVGDVLGDARIAAITPGSVVLDTPAGPRTLQLAQPGMRRTPAAEKQRPAAEKRK